MIVDIFETLFAIIFINIGKYPLLQRIRSDGCNKYSHIQFMLDTFFFLITAYPSYTMRVFMVEATFNLLAITSIAAWRQAYLHNVRYVLQLFKLEQIFFLRDNNVVRAVSTTNAAASVHRCAESEATLHFDQLRSAWALGPRGQTCTNVL